MRKALRFVTLGVGWVLVVATAVAIWLHHAAARGDLSLYLTSAVPFAVVAGVAGIIVFCAARVWLALIPAVAVVVGLLWTQAPLWHAQAAASGGHEFTVVSSNLLFGGADVDDVLAEVRASHADILSVQEMTPAALDRLRAGGVDADLPYSYVLPAPSAAGTGLFSRYPLSDTHRVDTMVLNNLVARVDLPDVGPTWIMAVHPIAPLRGQARLWNFEMSEVANTLHALPGPRAIAAGDFNATWDHAQFRHIASAGYHDAAEQAGAGLVFTYPTDRWGHQPFLALDHVVSRGFVASGIRSFQVAGSDHRGVLGKVRAS